MFMIENTQPNTRVIGSIQLIPGLNRVDPKQWELAKKKFPRQVEKLFGSGIIIAKGGKEKLSIATVEKTFDVPTLNEMLEDARGPLKGAIRKQIKMITGEAPEEKTPEVLGEPDTGAI